MTGLRSSLLDEVAFWSGYVADWEAAKGGPVSHRAREALDHAKEKLRWYQDDTRDRPVTVSTDQAH